MDGQELQKTARDHTAELPGTDQEHRFDPDWELHKVGGKVFMLMTDMPGRLVVILKADPDDATALRKQYCPRPRLRRVSCSRPCRPLLPDRRVAAMMSMVSTEVSSNARRSGPRWYRVRRGAGGSLLIRAS
ncbi:MmcQ/YjbR family DNA-binding protein [Streptomyces sp. NBC_01171]|uniref:MmcQ/YjbR family DNA-binding protein n=1 Tax=Streptomyces sp. NBC_01171 TaxID=2903757 RepID=UPI003870D892|nr:MmcQ/YjbR family DNA-binding protein [Streptomyces sp. NBC_01171]